MQNLNFLDTELLDILFRGKNKNYGAYTLRKNYSSRVKQALGITMLGVMLFFGLQFVFSKNKPSTIIDEITCELPFIKPLEGPVEIISTKPSAAAPILETTLTKQIPTEIEQHENLRETQAPDESEPTPNENIKTTGLPTTNNPNLSGNGGEGTNTNPTAPVLNGGSSLNTNTGATTSAKPVDMTPVNSAEVLPEFPGGEDAMLAFLRDRIRYPKMAADIAQQGLVYVQFVVNTEGGISNIKVLKGIGMGCDKEAMRVIKKMPKWTPASNGGHKVNFSFVLPIQFEL